MVCSANAAVFAHRLAITLEPPGPTPVNRYTFEPLRYFKTSIAPGVVCVRRSSDQARKAGCSTQSASSTAPFGMVFLALILELNQHVNWDFHFDLARNRYLPIIAAQ